MVSVLVSSKVSILYGARGRCGGGGRWRSTVTATVTTVSGRTSLSFGWLRRSTKPVGRWKSRSMTRGGSPSRDNRRANSFSSFGPTPGSAERAAKSGLSTFGRIELILHRRHPPTLSSSAKADDPVITVAADQISAPRLLGGPPSRAMTIRKSFSIYPSPGRVRAFGVWRHHDGTIERGPG